MQVWSLRLIFYETGDKHSNGIHFTSFIPRPEQRNFSSDVHSTENFYFVSRNTFPTAERGRGMWIAHETCIMCVNIVLQSLWDVDECLNISRRPIDTRSEQRRRLMMNSSRSSFSHFPQPSTDALWTWNEFLRLHAPWITRERSIYNFINSSGEFIDYSERHQPT